MGARWILGLLICLGSAGCTGIASSATPTGHAAVTTVDPAPTDVPTPATTSGSPTATAEPQTPMPTMPPIPTEPPKPASVTFEEERVLGSDASATEITQTITWGEPRRADVEIRVYGVTECIARPSDPAPATSGPCLVIGTPLPASVRTLLATAPAADGAVSWTWTGTFECGEPVPAYDPLGPAYHAIVLAAYNPSGHSIFAIAAPGEWWEPGPDDIVC